MATVLLLVLIYIAFISLGLPDSLLGVAWPRMRVEWGLPLDAAGYVSVFIVAFTVLSSVLSGRIIRWFGTGKVTMWSGVLTGVSILGISFAPSFYWLVALSCSLGFGAGSVDTALNHYVAMHFKAYHMNWLHCFWGVGASLGPLFISNAFAHGSSWRSGYVQVGVVQLLLALLLFISLPLWKMHSKKTASVSTPETVDSPSEDGQMSVSEHGILKVRGLLFMMIAFALYCAAENGMGLWGSSYLIGVHGLPPETAALYISVYFMGITSGRFVAGFLSMRLNNAQMIRGGVALAFLSAGALLMPIPEKLIVLPLFAFGLGLAPMFPAMMHETPIRFGRERSQYIIGYQMAAASMGSALFPPVFGVLLKTVSMQLLPVFVAVSVLMVGLGNERLNSMTRPGSRSKSEGY